MEQLIVFDLDDTLCKVGKGMEPEDVELLRELEHTGARIALCSGKPTYYLCGFMRQIGLKDPVLVGENGAVIQFGVELPPRRFYVQPYSPAAGRSLNLLKERISAALPGLWFQPNTVMVSPFPYEEEQFEVIQRILDESWPEVEDVFYYRHWDCFDILPVGVNKGSGVAALGRLLNIPASQTVAVGDSLNDYAMFDYAGLALGVNAADESRVAANFSSTGEMLSYLLGRQKD